MDGQGTGACAAWADGDPLMRDYHDRRWCKPVHDDTELFALLMLEGFQAGLSWSLIIRREAGMRAACDGFDPRVCAGYGPDDCERLLHTDAMIRSRRKIAAIGQNARAFQRIQAEYGSFDAYLWGFTQGQVVDHRLRRAQDTPTRDALSEQVSRDLKKRGFAFVGPVTTYSYLQAAGVINDHLVDCPYR